VKRLFLILLLLTTSAFAEERFTIEADTFDTPEESVYHAIGNVKVFQGDKTLLADEIYYYKDKNKIHAISNVRLTEEGKSFQCEEMEYDTDKQSGVFTNVKAFMEPYHWFTASKLDRHNEYSYGMEDATYSTCSGSNPDWSFKSKQADLLLGGYLTSKHTTGRIKDFPVFYTPYFIYPVKTERESGFLVPDFGYSSTYGPYVVPKYFWNIDVDQDATFGAMLSPIKSPLYSLEYRNRPSSREDFYTYAEYSGASQRHPDNVNGEYNMVNQKGRYLLYNYGRLNLTDNLTFYSSIKSISDYEYLDDYNKFNDLNDFESNNDIYKTTLSLSYPTAYANFYLKYMDEMDYTVGSRYVKEHTYSQPNISIQKNITTLPVYVKYSLQYDKVRYTRFAYRYATNASSSYDYNVDREHASLTLYKPANLYIATFTPSITLFKTKWHNMGNYYERVSDYYNSQFANVEADDKTITRSMYAINHKLKFNEIYKNYSNFKHSIYNSITYKQIPYVNQARMPNLITSDRINLARYYIYTLENFFVADKWSVTTSNSYKYNRIDNPNNHDTHTGKLTFSTKPFKFKIKHKFDVIDHEDEYFRSSAKLRLYPIVITANYTFDKGEYDRTNEDDNTAANLQFLYSSTKYDLSYTRTMSGNNTAMTTANMDNTKDTVDLTYKSDCWNFTITYERETDPLNVDYEKAGKTEHSVMFSISLKGLGNSKHGFRDISKYEFDDEEDEDDFEI